MRPAFTLAPTFLVLAACYDARPPLVREIHSVVGEEEATSCLERDSTFAEISRISIGGWGYTPDSHSYTLDDRAILVFPDILSAKKTIQVRSDHKLSVQEMAPILKCTTEN